MELVLTDVKPVLVLVLDTIPPFMLMAAATCGFVVVVVAAGARVVLVVALLVTLVVEYDGESWPNRQESKPKSMGVVLLATGVVVDEVVLLVTGTPARETT